MKHVTGVREVRDNLKKIKNGLDVPIRASLRKSAQPLYREVVRNAPVDDGVLKRSLKMFRVLRLPPGHVAYRIGASGVARFYAHIAEWGRIAGGRHIRGSRFMTRAFDTKAPEVIDRFKTEFPKELEKRIAYLAKKGRTL